MVGIDLVDIDDVREALGTHGDRYLRRIYTEREIEESRGRPERLAERFAAKEAALKFLRREDEAIPWRAVEVRGDSVWVEGRELALSVAHGGPVAAAVVVAR
jgi:holo-[acyl-carrier protein] synthase